MGVLPPNGRLSQTLLDPKGKLIKLDLNVRQDSGLQALHDLKFLFHSRKRRPKERTIGCNLSNTSLNLWQGTNDYVHLSFNIRDALAGCIDQYSRRFGKIYIYQVSDARLNWASDMSLFGRLSEFKSMWTQGRKM